MAHHSVLRIWAWKAAHASLWWRQKRITANTGMHDENSLLWGNALEKCINCEAQSEIKTYFLLSFSPAPSLLSEITRMPLYRLCRKYSFVSFWINAIWLLCVPGPLDAIIYMRPIWSTCIWCTRSHLRPRCRSHLRPRPCPFTCPVAFSWHSSSCYASPPAASIADPLLHHVCMPWWHHCHRQLWCPVPRPTIHSSKQRNRNRNYFIDTLRLFICDTALETFL